MLGLCCGVMDPRVAAAPHSWSPPLSLSGARRAPGAAPGPLPAPREAPGHPTAYRDAPRPYFTCWVTPSYHLDLSLLLFDFFLLLILHLCIRLLVGFHLGLQLFSRLQVRCTWACLSAPKLQLDINYVHTEQCSTSCSLSGYHSAY